MFGWVSMFLTVSLFYIGFGNAFALEDPAVCDLDLQG